MKISQVFLLIGSLALGASPAVFAASCKVQDIRDKVQYCESKENGITDSCTSKVSPRELAFAKEQFGLAFQAGTVGFQDWLCDLSVIRLVDMAYMAESDKFSLTIDSGVIANKATLADMFYFDLPEVLGNPKAICKDLRVEERGECNGTKVTLAVKEAMRKSVPKFGFRGEEGKTWPALLFLAAHEYGHFLLWKNKKMDCTSSASCPFQGDYKRRFIKKAVTSEGDFPKFELELKSILSSGYFTTFSTNPRAFEEICEVVAVVEIRQAIRSFSVTWSDGSALDLLGLMKKPDSAAAQAKMDYVMKFKP